MTLAHAFLGLATVCMALDLATTLAGMRRGAIETNELALVAMLKLGPVRGLIAFELAWLAFAAGVVAFDPSQWALPLLMAAVSGLGAINNIAALCANGELV